MSEQPPREGVKLTPQQEKSRRARNVALGVVIAVLAVLFYAVTIVKLGPGILNKGM